MQPKCPNQSGQALLEYMALLLVSVLLICGIVYKFNDAFRQYLDAWFGPNESGYLYCLIENGLLPGESDTCTLPKFNLNNGKSLAGGTGEKSGAGGGGAGGKGGGRGGSGGGSLSGDRYSRGGGLVPYSANKGSSNEHGGAGGKGGAEKGAGASGGSTGDLDFSNVGRQKGSQNGNGKLSDLRGARGSIPVGGDLGSGKVQGSQNVPATERDLNPARFVSAEKKRSQKIFQDVDASFSFGKVLKYIIILIIGFSILFFVGSQLVVISRGNKKRN